MKIIRNTIIPFPGFAAINLFGILFVRKEAYISENTLNHESIHSAQMREMLYIFFYIWYVVEWLFRLVQYRFDAHLAYRAISFEQEAYRNQDNLQYLDTRKHYAQFRKTKP